MKKWILAGAVCAVLFTACDKDDDNNDVNSTDRTFVPMASISNNAEIMAGQLAATKAQSSAVKAYGQMMVMDHTTAQQDLKSRASSAGLDVSDTVDAMHQQLMAHLNSLDGYSFDTAYLNSQVMDHTNSINLFNTEVSSGSNQNLRNYASTYLPKLQMHFKEADSLRKTL